MIKSCATWTTVNYGQGHDVVLKIMFLPDLAEVCHWVVWVHCVQYVMAHNDIQHKGDGCPKNDKNGKHFRERL